MQPHMTLALNAAVICAVLFSLVAYGVTSFKAANAESNQKPATQTPPLSKTIGFIGDSLTYGSGAVNPATDAAPAAAVRLLGQEYRAINHGIGGKTTEEWAKDACKNERTACLTDAIESFKKADVDIVHISLGTNDVRTDENISPSRYYNNLQSIVNRLKEHGFKRVIVSRPIYFGLLDNDGRDEQSLKTLSVDYYHELKRLAAENKGYVFLGDTDAYEWFKEHYDYTGSAGTYYGDSTHPTTIGYTKLGEFWAKAIKATIQAPTPKQ